MLKQQANIFSTLAIFLDMLLIAVAFAVSHLLSSPHTPLHDSFQNYWLLLLVFIIWFFSLYSFGVYESMRSKRAGQIFANLFTAHLTASVVLSSFIFLIDAQMWSNTHFLLFFCLSFSTLLSGKLFLRFVLYQFRRRGFNVRNILLVGSGPKADEFIRLIEHHVVWGFRITGIVDASSDVSNCCRRYPYLGTYDDVIAICKREMVDEVVFCLSSESGPVSNLVHKLNEMGVTSRMVLDFIDFPANRSELSIFDDQLPILTFYSKAFDAQQLFAKRLLDILGASIGLLLFACMLPFLALLIRIDSPGPIFFGQERVGENGRRFKCWKLRSMFIDSEQRKKELLARNEMSGAMFKIENDPRVTPVGRFLRKSSLDEFPQFWNVLHGEMSLVGTRPPTPDEVSQYEDWHRKRICIKPGLTGLWQISGRSQIRNFDEVARLDIRYIENWSMSLDFIIIFKTIWVVTAGRGAS